MKIPVFITAIAITAFVLLQSPAYAGKKEWVRLWPAEADAAGTVKNSEGEDFPATGEGAATWFVYNGAGKWKRFSGRAGEPVLISAYGDSGAGATLGHLKFRVVEVDGESRREVLDFKGPDWDGIAPNGEPRYRLVWYRPKTDVFEIAVIDGGFYVEVYQMRDRPDEAELGDEEKKKAAGLIKKLSHGNWRVREKAQNELIEMGPKVLALLDEVKDDEDEEVRERVETIIEALAPLLKEAIPEKILRKKTRELVNELGAYIGLKEMGIGAEPALSLKKIGPYAVGPLVKLLDNENPHTRRAAVKALGDIKAKSAVGKLMQLLAKDPDEDVRCLAADALAEFDGEKVKAALTAASQNDGSQKVTTCALAALEKIERREKTGDF